MRERWSLSAGTDALRVNDGINDHGVTMQREAETVAFDNALETSRRLYVDPNTPPDVRDKAKKDIEGAIQQGRQSGLLDPNQAEVRRKQFIEDAEFSRGKLAVDQDPSIISKPMPQNVAERASTAVGYFQSQGWTKEQAAGIVGNLMAESTLNTGARNGGDGSDGSDSIGIGQWNSNRARSLKAFAEQNHTDWRDFGTQLAFVQHELTHNESNAAGLLKNAKDVKSATEAMIMYERPAGSDKGPQNAMAYKTRLQYAAQAAGQDVNPDWYRNISPEQRAVIDNEAETRRNQIAVESRAGIEVATANAPTAILNTGAYSGDIPSAERFFQAYGPQDGASRYSSFVSSLQTSKQAYDMRTMSAGDIKKVVDEAKPVSSGDDAALEQKRYDFLSSAADATLKAREADPATYVKQAFPAVAARWAAAPAIGNYQSAVAASIAAQQQLGIRDPQPLPKDIADNAVNIWKDENQPQANRIGAVSSIIMATNDPGQRKILFNQMVKSGLPDITEGAFEALSRGDEGAAQRLFQAAMVDPSKLAGKIPNDIKTSDIDQAVQETLMDEGQIGDLYYGLSNGTADNYTRATRDAKLINNSVNIRLRNGETMDQAIAGVAKDLYGDVKPVTADNVQIIVPNNQDAEAVVSGLQAALPDVKAALTTALAPPAAGPSGPVKGQIAAGNIDLATRPVVKNDDGTISTVRSMSYENDAGQEVLIPTVSNEGKVMSNDEAIKYWGEKGQFLGKFDNPDDATAYAESLHESQAQFYAGRATGGNAIMNAVTSDSINRILSEGYFRNSGGGYVFIDPYLGAAVADAQGNPIIFKPNMAKAAPSAAPVNPLAGGPQPFAPQTNSPVSGVVPQGLDQL
ncbi:phage tail tip lysozyme [Mesorhizobium sp. ESP-6-2]|uniref:phage tail tip lysozyme n=1 Tax=Mesorhizobium sp. ESP-6-2 TaxID=2876625 RepID=UPI001CCE184B|nr:phage tail tip lysozyme [Mesorhizobium sp. ESP-6-2]MBZ9807701.1 phage tail-type lysozyme domain-containing protein [Mesorhizobium sp. ESP-6-2]